MAVTPQTNTTLEEIAGLLCDNESFALCGHVNPDGDCLGSVLGLASALRAMGKQVTCLNASSAAIPSNLEFLPGSDSVSHAETYQGSTDVFVALDTPNESRQGEFAHRAFFTGETTVVIDHHAVDERMADYSYTDADATSTTMLVWKLIGMLPECAHTVDAATCCYTGLITDSGGFKYQNTDNTSFLAAAEMVEAGANPSDIAREAFQSKTLAAINLESLAVSRMRLFCDGRAVISWLSKEDFESLSATKADAEGVINVLRSIKGVSVACVLREEPDRIRGSLRSKDETDVRTIAQRVGGGGHRAAAGLTLQESLPDAVARLTGLIEAELESR